MRSCRVLSSVTKKNCGGLYEYARVFKRVFVSVYVCFECFRAFVFFLAVVFCEYVCVCVFVSDVNRSCCCCERAMCLFFD